MYLSITINIVIQDSNIIKMREYSKLELQVTLK